MIKMVLSTHTSILSTLVSTPYKSPFAPRFAAQHKPLSGHWMWTLEQNLITKFGHQAAERCVNIKPNLVTLQQTPQGAPIFLLFVQAPPPFASSSHVALSEKFGIKVHQFTLVDLLLRLYWTTFATIQPFGQKIVLSHLKLTSEMF